MKYSQQFIPTLRELPSDAEVNSHILMLRASLIRQITSGIYCYLPLGYKVLRKIEAVVREEMDAAGALELHMPALISADYYKESGRWDVFGSEMFRLKDRNDKDFCLGPTHEELFTDLVKNFVKSYKNLPITLYQIQEKYRDEFRPRYGVIRSKEFLMKDAYSFDVDEAGLDISYQKMAKAYRRIFDRLGLKYMVVDADTGAMGGSGSQEFMVLSPVGEDTIIYCDDCGYASNLEKASFAFTAEKAADMLPVEKVYTPTEHTIEQVCASFNCEAKDVAKTLIYLADGKPVAVMVRGDRELNETKFAKLIGASELEMAPANVVTEVTKAEVGFAGPVGLTVPVYADRMLENKMNLIVGANESMYHLKNVCVGRDYTVTAYADVVNAEEGDVCPVCGKLMKQTRGVEVGHIFKLGRKYTDAMDCKYLNVEGQQETPIMGCYGIGVSRVMAAIIEQNCDEKGIIWPKIAAPYQVVVVALGKPDSQEMAIAEQFHDALTAKGVDVLLDDRNERAGVKFNDADLIGIPVRVTIGRKAKDGIVEFKYRNSEDVFELTIEEAIAKIISE